MKRALAVALAVGLAAAGAAEPVPLTEIRAARRAEGQRWYLALGAPADAGVVTRECDLGLQPGRPVELMSVPAFLQRREFTVLLRLTEVSGGVLRLGSPQAPGDVRAAVVSRDGWAAICFGPVEGEGELLLQARATCSLRITQVTAYRSLEQLFGSGGRIDLVGAAFRRLGEGEILGYPLLPGAYRHHRTGQWNGPPLAVEDGIPGGRLAESYRAFFNGPLEANQGLEVPVRAPGGVILCARLKGRFAFIVYPEIAKYILFRTGEQDTWSVAQRSLDGAELDGDGNGVFTGRHKQDWNHAKTWVDNYGTGFLNFVVMLPQNEMAVPATGARRLLMRYHSTAGLKPLDVTLPEGTDAVALLHAGPRTTAVLARSEGEYSEVTRIEDSAYRDCLAVQAGSVCFE
ncbi:MAG: hypothetical protein U9R79_05050 [Armatimonadota bacterium]|nr:hypothetical protein [Armatimonadota bacterium]